jgi:superfamily II DNA or RNA helicase
MGPADPYGEFLAGKVRRAPPAGFEAQVDHPALFPFQRDAVSWALRQGRCALFEDTGLGKTLQELVWADHVARRTGRPVLILAPLAVAAQTVREATKFGLEATQVRDQAEVRGGVVVTNYDRLHLLDPSVFGGVVLDESSILKAFSGTTKQALCAAFAETPYRLAATATPAPNDHLELGNHSEFLGVLTSHQMIARWFINDTSTFGTYRLKGHAVEPFWDWVCSWARCASRPSDLGPYSDEGYVLPELRIRYHAVAVDRTIDRGDSLFREIKASATALHAERRRTASDRAARVAEIVSAEATEPWVVWCDTDYDADAVMDRLPDAVEVHGGQSADRKAELLGAFADGAIRVLVTKPSLAGFGLNWQHCARQAFAGPSYSYEAFYQAVRRSWRFGQLRPVETHVVLAATEQVVWQTLLRKGADHESMKVAMFAASRRAQARAAERADYHPTVSARLPAWLTSETA